MCATQSKSSTLVHPRKAVDLIEEDLGAELLVYRPAGREIHVLNSTARLVWRLCDGAHSAPEIAAELRSRFAVRAGHDPDGDVQHLLTSFTQKHLLREGVGASA